MVATLNRPAGCTAGVAPAVLYDLGIGELACRCETETAHYLRNEPYAECYGLELFRRAIVQRDDQAWSAIYEQYRHLVGRWLGPTVGDPDEGITEAFRRFWRAVDAEKFSHFDSLSTVLRYLQMCARTTRIDYTRAYRSCTGEGPLDAAYAMPSDENVEGEIAARIDGGEFWRAVDDALTNRRERIVVYLSYVVGLSPRAIYARHQELFCDVSEIYRLKRSILERLRRQQDIQSFLDDGLS